LKETPAPPEQLLRPGIAPQMVNNSIKKLLFMGGNESKRNYLFDFNVGTWVKAGVLPDFHLVTEHINVTNNDQTITVFTQVNFEKNQFEVCMASNNGNLDEEHQWTWLFKDQVNVQNFHIKSAVLVKDRLVLTARGKPKDVFEQCCSFLMIFNAKLEGQLITGFDADFHFIKLDPVVYP
jgi:hypothetical protein